MKYNKGEHQKTKIIKYLADYKDEHDYYPGRQQIADELGISLAYAVELVRQLADKKIIKTSPPWEKNKKQWTIIVGLKRKYAQSAREELS